MFQHHCTVCGRTEPIFPSMVHSLTSTERGIEVRFECWCGAEQAMLSGRRAQRGSSQRKTGQRKSSPSVTAVAA
ncbi:hypothetical protein [Nocardioides sp. KR10-350]|uniref:hypothetical protein n=1 Tax=Nocardioides cheoyonin TaxID=3156615 RepID=UPI0032B42E18